MQKGGCGHGLAAVALWIHPATARLCMAATARWRPSPFWRQSRRIFRFFLRAKARSTRTLAVRCSALSSSCPRRRGGATNTPVAHTTSQNPVEEHTIRIRVDETVDGRRVDPSTRQRRFNRTEHLRQVPADTPAGRRPKGFRQDSESTHRDSTRATPTRELPRTERRRLCSSTSATPGSTSPSAAPGSTRPRPPDLILIHQLTLAGSRHPATPSADRTPPATLSAAAQPSSAAPPQPCGNLHDSLICSIEFEAVSNRSPPS